MLFRKVDLYKTKTKKLCVDFFFSSFWNELLTGTCAYTTGGAKGAHPRYTESTGTRYLLLGTPQD